MNLYQHQMDALKRMKNGCILNGGVGSGKSRTSLCYYWFYIAKGGMCINGKSKYSKPKNNVPLYIITTARKRDTEEWGTEMSPFLLSSDKKHSVDNISVTVDSWNNIQKYKNVTDSFFIFDEQRVVGKGAWVKAFLQIAKTNQWILLSATPGDTWMDYVPVFIANGFYKNRTEFNREHVIFSRWAKYPKVDKYINTGKLIKYRNLILVNMDYDKQTVAHDEYIIAKYNLQMYKAVMKNRWNPFEDKPIQQASELCYVLRRVVNASEERIIKLKELLKEHSRSIIFYNFDYELAILEDVGKELKIATKEWNGHKHEPIPKTKSWIYLVQYTAGAEGWNCIETNVIIFYSQNYSYKTMVQAAGRIDRLNTPFSDLYYYHIRSSSGIDLAIYEALRRKKNFNEKSYLKA